MDSEKEELYLIQLHEYVYDEDKIITAVWLSRKLKLEVSLCKNLINTFIKDQRSSKQEELVKEDDLEEKRKLFKEIDEEEVYSVQKMKNIDFNVLAMVDMLNIDDSSSGPVLGSVIGRNCIKRNLKEKKILPEVSRAAPTDKSKASHLFSKVQPKRNDVKEEEVETTAKEETTETTSVKEEKTSPKLKATTKKPSNKKLENVKAKSNTLQNMFAKASQNPVSKPKPKENKEELKEEKVHSDSEKMDVDIEPEPPKKKKLNEDTSKENKFYDSGTDDEAKKVEEGNKDKKENEKGSAKKRQNSKRQRKPSTERVQKRRKRIVEHHDSDSDDIFGGDNEDQEEEIVALSDDEPTFKSQSEKILAPKNKKRKLVDKTFTDEEGYIVTKKEWVYESGDEEEEKEQKNPQIEKPIVKKEISPPKPTKGKKNAKGAVAANQPTLMNFFKKK